MPLDYSKWKDIEVSDDEDDTHPNVDTPSLFRWRHQSRLERMAEKKAQKEEIEIQKNDYQKKLDDIQRRMKSASISDEDKKKLEAEYAESEKQYQTWLQKEKELADQEKHDKWNVDTISHEKWSTSRINKASSSQGAPKKSEEEEMKEMRAFFDKHGDEIARYAKCKTFDESQKYLVEHPHLCCEYTANHITLDALNAGILQKESTLRNIARQCVTLQFLLDLAKSLKANAQQPTLIEGFFRKINAAEDSYMKMFNEEVDAFLARVHTRAAEKRQEYLKEAEEEEKQKRIQESPGGLDPVEVFESLPQSMKDAFESQEVSRLQECAASMPIEEFQHHLDRCIKSGLWLPEGNKNKQAEATPAADSDMPVDSEKQD